MHVGEKIRQIRKAKGLSQENLAYDIECSPATISRIEQGGNNLNSDLLKTIKKALGVEGIPLLPNEENGFKERLYIWRKLCMDQHLNEARSLQQGLANILDLPFEKDLVILYQLFEINMLLIEENIEAAQKNLLSLTQQEMSFECMYHYYFNTGSLRLLQRRNLEALDSFLHALKIEKENALRSEGELYAGLAFAYSRVGQPFRSVMFFEIANQIYGENKRISLSLQLDNKLAYNYIVIGEVHRARALLDTCLMNAKSIDDEMLMALTLHNYGWSYIKTKQWNVAFDYFDQSIELYRELSTRMYLEDLYNKIRCLIALKKFTQSKELIAEAAEFYEGDEYFSLHFESLSHLMRLRENASSQYIKNVTIPYLISIQRHDLGKALDYCETLEEHYTNKGNVKRALKIAAIERNIYKSIVVGSMSSLDSKIVDE